MQPSILVFKNWHTNLADINHDVQQHSESEVLIITSFYAFVLMEELYRADLDVGKEEDAIFTSDNSSKELKARQRRKR